MDGKAAHSALMESLARPSGTPCAWRDDPDAYIDECKDDLLAHLIEPRPVQAGGGLESRSLMALARHYDAWLLLDPGTRKFFKAFGSDPDKQPLGMLEFESDDALLEWIG